MKNFTRHFLFALVVLLLPATEGCRARMQIATGTTIGLVANPGDGSSRPPRVTLAYRRAEVALVPTDQRNARKEQGERDSDCYSSLAVFNFHTKWFGETSIEQFFSTGHASREVVTNGPEFAQSFAAATFKKPSPEIEARRDEFIQRVGQRLTAAGTPAQREKMCADLLKLAGYPDPQQSAETILRNNLLHVRDDAAMKNFEAALGRLP